MEAAVRTEQDPATAERNNTKHQTGDEEDTPEAVRIERSVRP